ncbi:MAG TPA: DUF4350 domain-containing protein [Vicinamibacterales bacterium]
MFRIRGDAGLLIAAAVLVTVVTAVGAWLEPAASLPGPRGSTFSASPTGAKAAYLLLHRLGYRVERSLVPFAALRLDPQRDLLIITARPFDLSAADRRAVAAFLDGGGIVLATGAALDAMPSAGLLPRKVSHPDEDRKEKDEESNAWSAALPMTEPYRAVLPGPLTRGVPSVAMAPELRIASPPPPYVAVYEGEAGVGVAAARIGRGLAIWWAGPDPLLNATIQGRGHLELLLNVLGPPGGRRIIWDEHSHGYARSLWAYIAGTPVPAALAQLALLGVVAWFTYARRHLPLRMPPEHVRASPLEFVEAMARLYGRAGAASGAVEVARTRTRRLLAAMSGLPASVSDDRLAAAASPRIGVPASTIAAALRESAAVDNATVSTREALELVQSLQDLASRAVHRGRKRADDNERLATRERTGSGPDPTNLT